LHLDEINRATIPILEGFPWKLSFDEDNLWVEACSYSRDELLEFQKVNPDILLSEDTTLMAAAGSVEDDSGEEYMAYAIYSYDGQLYFLTINHGDENCTYDYSRSVFVVWKD